MSRSHIKNSLLHTFLAHKLEALTIAVFSVFFILAPSYFLLFNAEQKSEEIYLCMPLFLVAIYLCRHNKFTYLVSILVPIIGTLILFFTKFDDFKFFILSIIFFIALLSDGFIKDDTNFIQNALKKLLNLSLALITSMIFLIILGMVGDGLTYLFEIASISKNVLLVCFLALVSWLFMTFEDAKFSFNTSFLERIFHFLLTPAFFIFTLIIYAYALKIAVFADLPKGGVAYIVLSYLICGIILQALSLVVREQRWSKFYRTLTLIALPLLVLLWVGIIARIGQYGFTPERIWLCGVAAMTSAIYTLELAKFLFSYRIASIIASGFLFVSFFVIDTKSITLNSQTARFERLLGELNLGKDTALNLTKLDKNTHQNLCDTYHAIKTYGGASQPILSDFDAQICQSPYEFGFRLHLITKELDITGFDKLIATDTECMDYNETLCFEGGKTTINVSEHIQKALKENDLDARTIHGEDKIAKLKPKLMQINLGGGKVMLTSLAIAFSRSRGYYASHISGVMLKKE